MPAAQKSRSRAMIGAQFAARRSAYAVVGRLAPRAMGRRAGVLYCQLPDNAGRRKDNRSGAGQIEPIEGPGGKTIVTERWGDGPLVYLVHGWGGWRGQMGAFVAPLVEQGMGVIAYDALSHGESDPGRWGPRHSTGGEIAESLATVIEAFGPAQGVIAHSLGCTSSTLVAHDGAPISSLALIAPAPDLVKAAEHYARVISLPQAGLPSMHEEIQRRAGRPWQDFDMPSMAVSGTLPPTLLVHDTKDKESPFKYGENLARSWPGAQFMATEGLGHQRILINPSVVARAAAHVTSLGSPVSGGQGTVHAAE